MSINAKLNIKKKMSLRFVVDLRFINNFDSDLIILDNEKKAIYAVIIVETSRKQRWSLRENINVILRKIVFEYFIKIKTTKVIKFRNQRLNNLEQDFITRVKRNEELAIKYILTNLKTRETWKKWSKKKIKHWMKKRTKSWKQK